MPKRGNFAVEPWKNPAFLQSGTARPIRILAEYLGPQDRLREHHIKNTIVFWGSSRILPLKEAKHCLQQAKKKGGKEAIREAECVCKLSRYYEEARELAKKLTTWSKSLGPKPDFIVATGGATGIMEAANRGASEAKGITLGLGIELPYEKALNQWVTHSLAFKFHYFFMRKFWMVYLAKALIVFPGGFGTLDELSEILTLCQTHKEHKDVPVVLYGKDYWNDVINFDAMVKHGTVSRKDLNIFKVVDSVDEAYEYLTTEIEKRFF